jgi:hypothetical protein
MKRILQILALLIVLGAAATWVATGANRGWTKTSVPVKTLDQVTGIEGITYQKKFLPGVDFLGAALAAAALPAAASLFFRRRKNDQNNTNQQQQQ